MAITIKKVTLWRSNVDNRPGALARVLEPMARAGADLQVAMGYHIPGSENRAVVEVAPVTGKKATAAAHQAGLAASGIPTLLVLGDNRPGLGHALAREIAAAGINLAFLVAQVVGRRYSAIFGFESEAEANKAVGLIKKASAARRR
jgi:hypothetical protein